MQADALALMLDGAGTKVVLAYVDDAYGRPFMERVRDELDRLGAPVTAAVEFDPQEPKYEDVARALVQSGSATIGIIGDPEAGPRLMQSLAEVIDPNVVTGIWMNDAMRVPATASVYRRLDPGILPLMHGVSPRSTIGTPDGTGSLLALPDSGRFFAANAYDCMSLIALAADQAESIDGAAMADQIQQVTTGGTPCDSFTDCVEQLRSGRNIDYDGPSGQLDIGRNGDPTFGLFDMYHFDERGLDVTDDREPIRVDGRNG
jgi:branched-chain amino acid transport system substrate-binding protein